jgi:hypothetical protein
VFVEKSNFIKNFLFFVLLVFIAIFIITFRKKGFKIKHFVQK